MKEQKVSCIIPVYDEETTIAGVIDVCLKVPEIKEIIVVDDASTDKTPQILNKYKKDVKVITLENNHGKGGAVAYGVRESTYPYILLLDADLINIKPHHLSSIIRPVLDHNVKMSVGDVLSDGVPLYSFLWQFSGQRCFPKKELLPLLEKIEKTNYAIEVILNEAFCDSTVVVPLVSKKPLRVKKQEKDRSWLLGSTGFIREILEISQSIVSHKSKEYQKKFNEDLIKSIATYLKVNSQKLKDFIQPT